jgi:hypothetical protein
MTKVGPIDMQQIAGWYIWKPDERESIVTRVHEVRTDVKMESETY